MNFTSDNIVTLYALVGVFLFGAIIVSAECIAEFVMRVAQ